MRKPKENERTIFERIPYSTVFRLTGYLRVVDQLAGLGVTRITSRELSAETNVKSYLVRKDLAYFGWLGRRGVGYETRELGSEIRKILGIVIPHKSVIVGAGNLGRALIQYGGFLERGIEICAIFDNDNRKIGTGLGDLTVEDAFALGKYIEDNEDVKIGIIAVPLSSAQEVADILTSGGIKGILNFAPVPLRLPEKVICTNVDIARQLEIISFYITHPEAHL